MVKRKCSGKNRASISKMQDFISSDSDSPPPSNLKRFKGISPKKISVKGKHKSSLKQNRYTSDSDSEPQAGTSKGVQVNTSSKKNKKFSEISRRKSNCGENRYTSQGPSYVPSDSDSDPNQQAFMLASRGMTPDRSHKKKKGFSEISRRKSSSGENRYTSQGPSYVPSDSDSDPNQQTFMLASRGIIPDRSHKKKKRLSEMSRRKSSSGEHRYTSQGPSYIPSDSDSDSKPQTVIWPSRRITPDRSHKKKRMSASYMQPNEIISNSSLFEARYQISAPGWDVCSNSDSESESHATGGQSADTENENHATGGQSEESKEEFSGSEEEENEYEVFRREMPRFFDSSDDEEEMEAEIPVNFFEEDFDRPSLEKTRSEAKDILKTNTQNFMVFPNRCNDQELVIMDHPAKVQLRGYMKVILLSGKATICGYELKPFKPVTVLSQKRTGFYSIESQYHTTELVDIINPSTQHIVEAIDLIKSHMAEVDVVELTKFAMKHLYPTATVIVLEEIYLPAPLRALQLYHPEAIPDRLEEVPLKNTCYTVLEEDKVHGLQFPTNKYDKIFRNILRHLYELNKEPSPGVIDKSYFAPLVRIHGILGLNGELEINGVKVKQDSNDAEGLKGSRIFVSGPKKSGKSTLLRYLVNKFLNVYEEVYYLDTDSGQTEFTPPGVISLNKITEPICSPPYYHLKDPVKSVFIGTISPETCPPMHMRAVQYLMQYFNKNFPKSVLFVNTFGRYEGLGEMIIDVVKDDVKPTVCVELTPDDSCLTASYEGEVLNLKVGFDMDAGTSTKKGNARPVDLRNYAILSYLGRCQRTISLPKYFNEVRPVSVRWDKIAIYHCSKRVPYNRYIEALTCSIVAICYVQDKYILEPTLNKEVYPVTLDDEPINECLGFGFVRAIDEENRLLYIITPHEQVPVKKANALMMGNILPPNSLFLEQPIEKKGLFYTDNSIGGPTEARKPIQRRTRFNLEDQRRSRQF